MTETDLLWRARCEATRAVSCCFVGADFAALDIDREPVPETAGNDSRPSVNVPALRANWEIVEKLAAVLAKRRRMPADEARRVVAEARIQAAVADELRIGDARSDTYREGMVDVLRLRVLQIPIPRRYRPGTVEFDAYYAGNDRGHALWRKMQASTARPEGRKA